MPFDVKLQPMQMGRGASNDPDSVLIGVMPNTKDGAPEAGFAVLVRIGPVPVARLNWQRGERVEVALGTGVDFGKLALTRLAVGRGYSLAKSGNYLSTRFTVRQLPGLARAIAKERRVAELVEYSIRDGMLLLKLPSWFYVKQP